MKIETPDGNPLARMCPGYYEDLNAGREVVRLDLKDQQDRASLAALEPHFWERLLQELEVKDDDRQDLEWIFVSKTAERWEEWATEPTSRSPR